MSWRWIATPLWVLLPLVWRAGLFLARAGTRDRRLSGWLAPGVALAMWLLAIHACGLVAHSFWVGLYAGTAVLAGIGAWSLRSRVDCELESPRTSRWIWPAMLLAAATLVGPVLSSKHDECLIVGHVSIPAEMLNGVYPPRHLTFPAYELRYHYGIDLADAVVSSLLGRLDVQLTVHIVAVLLFGYTFALYWLLGDRLVGGRAAGPVTAACVMYAGGGPVFLGHAGSPASGLESVRFRGGTWITPPMISNFLQHPWSLGLPIVAMMLLVWLRCAGGKPSRSAWLLLGVLGAMLSLAQTTLFVCVVPCLVAAGAFEGRRVSIARLGRWLAWAIALVIAARLMHGFLAPTPEPAEGRLGFHPFLGDTNLGEFVLWHVESFGALVPLGIAGLFVLRRQRLLLGLLAGGGIVVRDLFKYWPGWNIVKFAVVSELALAILAAAAISAALQRRRWWPAGIVGLAACTMVSIAFSVTLTTNAAHAVSCLPRSSEADRRAIAFLRPRMVAGEAVFASRDADAYAVFGGLPQQTWDWGVRSFGFSDTLYAERQRLIDHPEDFDAMRAQGFRWLVLSDEDTAVRDAARRLVADQRAELAAEFSPLVVFRLR